MPHFSHVIGIHDGVELMWLSHL